MLLKIYALAFTCKSLFFFFIDANTVFQMTFLFAGDLEH